MQDFDFFGIPLENIRAAEKWAKKYKKKCQYHTQVPTRKEVQNLPVEELKPLLTGWLVHSPTEIIPSAFQIELVLELLRERDDAAELSGIIAMCKHYVSGQ